MNVNTTDATTGATTLLLPAQKTHACVNLHMSTGVKNCLYKHKGGARARPGPVGIPYPGYRLPPPPRGALCINSTGAGPREITD